MGKNELAKATSTEVSTEVEMDWGTNEASSKDIVIPKIQLMQGMSKKVLAGEAKLGDLIDSVTGEKLGDASSPIKVIPFHMEKFFVVQKEVTVKGKVKYEYDHVEKITPATENAEWNYEHEGQKFKRVYTRNFYVLVPGKVLPYVIGFSSTSSQAGKELATEMFVKNTMQNRAPCATMVLLGCRTETNDDGTFAVKTVKAVEDTSKEGIALAYKWFTTVRKEETKVDDAQDF